MDDSTLRRPELLTPTSIADLYLLAVAVTNKAKLATFDKRIQPTAIGGGKGGLEIIPVSVE